MTRPKIKIEKKPIDHFLEKSALLGLAFLLIYPTIHFGSLPEEIPTHFDLNGQPDDYDKKSSIWILPVIGLLIFIMFYFIQKIPHTFNYGVKITAENAETQYKIALRIMYALNAIVMISFAYLNYSTIQIALGKATELGSAFTPIFILGIFGIIGIGIFKSFEKK